MEKWLCLGSLITAGLMTLIFLMDLFMGMPFSSSTPPEGSSPFTWVDIFGCLAGGLLGYLAFNAYRDVK